MKVKKRRKIYFHPAFLVVCAISFAFDFYEQFFIMWGIMLFHEGGHFIAAKYLGMKIKIFKIMPFGAELRFENQHKVKGMREIALSISGPLVNLLFCISSIAFLPQTESSQFFICANASVFIFNMLPVLPLDGGRIMKALFYLRSGEISSVKYVLVISKIFDVILIILGFGILYYTEFNFSILLIGVFVMFYIFDENKNYALLEKKAALDYKSKLVGKNSLKTRSISAKDGGSAASLLNNFTYKDFCVVNVLDKHYTITGILTEAEIIDYLMNIDSGATVFDILKFSIASYGKAL